MAHNLFYIGIKFKPCSIGSYKMLKKIQISESNFKVTIAIALFLLFTITEDIEIFTFNKK